MACDVRLAAYSASFGQPEINLGIIPGFGGTQRLPRLVGPAKALEMNTTGESISAEEAYEYGLVNRLVADHELFDAALAWARKFARQAPLALEHDQARLARAATSTRASPPRRRRSPTCSRPRTRARASARSCRSATRSSRGGDRRPRPPRRADPLGGVGRRAHRRGHLGAVRHPRLPLARHGPVGERRPDGGRPHLRLAARAGALLGVLRAALRRARGQAAQRRPPRARRARGRRPARRRDHPEHRRPARRGRLARRDRGPRLDRLRLVPRLRRALPAGGHARARGGGRRRRAALRVRRGR